MKDHNSINPDIYSDAWFGKISEGLSSNPGPRGNPPKPASELRLTSDEIEEVRKIRDKIEQKVKDLFDEIENKYHFWISIILLNIIRFNLKYIKSNQVYLKEERMKKIDEFKEEHKEKILDIPGSPFPEEFGKIYEWGTPIGLTLLVITAFLLPVSLLIYYFINWVLLLGISFLMLLIASPLVLYGKWKSKKIEKKAKRRYKMIDEYEDWLENRLKEIEDYISLE